MPAGLLSILTNHADATVAADARMHVNMAGELAAGDGEAEAEQEIWRLPPAFSPAWFGGCILADPQPFDKAHAPAPADFNYVPMAHRRAVEMSDLKVVRPFEGSKEDDGRVEAHPVRGLSPV